jgi:hypothetical protein
LAARGHSRRAGDERGEGKREQASEDHDGRRP